MREITYKLLPSDSLDIDNEEVYLDGEIEGTIKKVVHVFSIIDRRVIGWRYYDIRNGGEGGEEFSDKKVLKIVLEKYLLRIGKSKNEKK